MTTQVVMVVLVLLLISGCSLPAPLSWLNYGRTAYDANQIIKDDATTADAALSAMMSKDCQIFNVLDSKEVCIERPKE